MIVSVLLAAIVGGGVGAATTHTLYANLTGNVTGNVTGGVTVPSGSTLAANSGSTVNLNTLAQFLAGQENFNGASYRVTSATSQNVTGDALLGLVGGAENSPYWGCAGTAVTACSLSFYSNGAGSPATATLDSSGNLNINGAFSATGSTLSGLTASQCVNTSAGKALSSAGGQCALLNNVNNTFTNNNTFGGPVTVNNTLDVNQSTVASCGGGPNSSMCSGSPGQTMGLAFGKQSGGWGGTTTSDSQQECFYSNNGTTDSNACNYYLSNKVLIIGLGASTTQLDGPNGSVANGAFESIRGAGTTKSYDPPLYTAAGGVVASTAHSVIFTISATVSTTCAQNVICTSGTQTFSGDAAFASVTSYSCYAVATNSTATFWNLGNTNGTTAAWQLYDAVGSLVAGTYTATAVCTGT